VSVLLSGCERVEAPDASLGVSWSIDFKQPRASVSSVGVGAADIGFEIVNDHIVIPAAALQVGRNEVEIEFLAGDGSLNRNREFLYTLFVPDRARFAFPCFDQPNLKARFNLTLEVPASWQAVANGRQIEHDVSGGRAVFAFAETKAISTYLFSFAAGDFQVVRGARGGREMRIYHRETDSTKVARNTSAIFDLHATALDWLEDYTGIPYPFEKFDFVLIPSFQYGGMEHPGAILYRASSLFLDESATQNAMLRRASLIAHETSHMWFGDLVTMDWFNDVWTKEVFANFMAAKIVNPSFPEVDHELRFLLAHYPAAYAVDRSEGANPIRQELDNLNEAGTLYGAIIYQKAPIVMRQLETLIGMERLREGLRQYLLEYQYRNAAWPDLIRILDSRTEGDLATWSRVWVEESRRPTVNVAPSIDAEGNFISLALKQSDPAGAGRVWSQQLHVMLARPADVRVLPVQLDAASAEITDVQGPAPDFILPNGMGVGYGLFELDTASLAYLLDNVSSLSGALTRGVVWLNLWDAVLEGRVRPERFVDVLGAALVSESDELLTQRLLGYLRACYWRYLPVPERNRRAPEIESLLWGLIAGAESASLKATYFNAFRSVAVSDDALGRLEGIWDGELTIEGLPLSERDYTRLAFELAVREVDSWESILDRQEARIENPDRAARFIFVRPALSADLAVRDRFFESLRDVANREHEPWVLEALGYLHHPLRAGAAEKHILPSLELLEEIQATGDIFFPKNWLDATLAGHSSESATRAVRGFLEDHPDLPARLRGKVLQSADGLFRAASILPN
jgi:aminopeptidase N